MKKWFTPIPILFADKMFDLVRVHTKMNHVKMLHSNISIIHMKMVDLVNGSHGNDSPKKKKKDS